MTDRDALLAAITANPDDDAPRLVYADWLQENGDEDRAEFIRVQCRLPHLSPAEAKPLKAREQELRLNVFGPLLGALGELGFARVETRRGFIDSITADLLPLLKGLGMIRLGHAPALSIAVRDESGGEGYDDADIVSLAAMPELLQCVSLHLPCLGMTQGEEILRSPNLKSLRRLDFPNNETGPGIELVASTTFANLRWANFHNSDSASDCPSIVPLAECDLLANLEYLDFGDCEQWDDGLRALAQAKQWSRLRHLDLSTSQFSAEAIGVFFSADPLPKLEVLDLAATFGEFHQRHLSGLGDPHVRAIADSPLFSRLIKLSLRWNGITDVGAKVLAGYPHELRLRHLDLSGNPISSVGKRLLRERFGSGVCVFERAARD